MKTGFNNLPPSIKNKAYLALVLIIMIILLLIKIKNPKQIATQHPVAGTAGFWPHNVIRSKTIQLDTSIFAELMKTQKRIDEQIANIDKETKSLKKYYWHYQCTFISNGIEHGAKGDFWTNYGYINFFQLEDLIKDWIKPYTLKNFKITSLYPISKEDLLPSSDKFQFQCDTVSIGFVEVHTSTNMVPDSN